MPHSHIITAGELAQLIPSGTIAQFWNVLHNDYFTWELIPGSRHVPIDRVWREVASLGLAKDTAIVVYCSGPSCPNSKQAGEKLTGLGFTNVRVFEGGLEAWKAVGGLIEALQPA
jgi:rhodanese-related sulfurtransferase